tara:strand:- start:3 stop:329 length:327 start_codon:yes stop_codon:yes gene_type:complete
MLRSKIDLISALLGALLCQRQHHLSDHASLADGLEFLFFGDVFGSGADLVVDGDLERFVGFEDEGFFSDPIVIGVEIETGLGDNCGLIRIDLVGELVEGLAKERTEGG